MAHQLLVFFLQFQSASLTVEHDPMADSPTRPLLERTILLVFAPFMDLVLSSSPVYAVSQKPAKPERPQIPFGLTSLGPVEVGVYDSKAQPAAEALQAVNAMSVRAWEVISKYYPELGKVSDNAAPSVNPANPEDRRIKAKFATEDPGRSPIPLVAMICSLDATEVSGRLKALRDELIDATRIEDYSNWSADRLTRAIQELTQAQTSGKGVKYKAAKKTLSFKETVQLYAMTVALLPKDTKWPQWEATANKLGYALPRPPDMSDFSNRLRHQLPMIIPPGATRGLVLYRPGWDIAQPLTKEEFEERADVVLIKRSGTIFQLQQFPIYLTADQKTWNPSWLIPEDDWKDSTLTARKFERLWTRFDGPYMWYKNDQLNGEDTYRATVKFQKGEILIEAERFVLRRGSVVRTARDPLYDPLNAKRFVAGMEAPTDSLTADLPDLDNWPDMWRQVNKNINETCYRPDDRELFWYKTGDNSWSSSIYPVKDGGPPILQPVRSVNTASSGIIARFAGSGAEQPNDAHPLDHDQQTSINIAVGLMNLCLANASGAEVAALRVSLPRDKENRTPIYFYSVANGTSVMRSPQSLVVVLSEGYYNGYISAFNRILWVLESAFQNDAVKNAAINRSLADYLKSGLPKDAGSQNDPAVIAWSEMLQNGDLDQLFNASILPGSLKQTSSSPAITADKSPATEGSQTAQSFRILPPSDAGHRSTLDSRQGKSASIAVGLLNFYLSESSGIAAELWRQWYPRGGSLAFLVAAAGQPGTAKEVMRESTSEQGEKHKEVSLTVELPERAYDNYLSTLVWLLGTLEVHARSRGPNPPPSTALGGQGTGVSGVLEYFRQLDADQENAAFRNLAEMGVDWKTLPGNIPDVPPMFLSAQREASAATATDGAISKSTTSSSRGDPQGAVPRPLIAAQFPADLGLGPLDPSEQAATREVIRLMNLYLSKHEEKRDEGAEQFRRTLDVTTSLYIYRNKSEAIHVQPGTKSQIFVGLPLQDASYPAIFLEMLRILEMQSERLTRSWQKRQDIAYSLRKFLDRYAKENPDDPAIAQMRSLDIKTMTELW